MRAQVLAREPWTPFGDSRLATLVWAVCMALHCLLTTRLTDRVVVGSRVRRNHMMSMRPVGGPRPFSLDHKIEMHGGGMTAPGHSKHGR